MKDKAKVVVIGGGVVGASALYHLAKKGWRDVVLVERKELTSGSTWHAAGLLPLFNMSYSVGKLHQYSVKFYQDLERETGQSVGFRQVSNIRLACTEDRMDEYRYYAGVGKTVGVAINFLTPQQVGEIWPMCNTEGLVGAIQHPEDGYIQPGDLTTALAKGARNLGAEIYRHTTVTAIEQINSGNEHWRVITDKGEITCEHVVSCSGNFARKTGAMVGLDLPVIPVEHQYIVTEPHPEILERKKKGLPEQGVLRESDAAYYLREEAGGMILGIYERGAPCCYVDGPAPDCENELFEPDLERLEPHIEACINRVPAFGEVGVKQVYNGAIAYTPDGNPIVGPAWGLKNFWLNEGHSFGVTAAGGAGWQLAEWIVDGEPTVDMMGVDPRRFGPYAARGYLREKNEEAYRNVFTTHFPDEERAAASPLKTAPCYERMKKLGAVFGRVYGWERPNWFAPPDYELPKSEIGSGDVLLGGNTSPPLEGGRVVEKLSFRRSNYFEFVGEECRHVADKVGLLDMSAFSKFQVDGRDAEEWLESLFCNRIPKTVGRVGLCHMLSENGGVRAEFTVYKTGENRYYLVSAGAMERHDWDCLQKNLPEDGGVRAQKITAANGVLVVAGPDSRKVLQKLTDADLESLKWLSGRPINIGAAQAHVLRVNFVGELGYELHHPIEMQNYIFDRVMGAGGEFDIRPFGIRAMDSMRLEKSYRLIPREMSIEYAALESGLDRFVRLDKEFIGRKSLMEWKKRGFENAFVTLEVDDDGKTDARGSEAIYSGEGGKRELAGRATSGGYGFRVKKSLALALVQPRFAEIGTELEIEILGEARRAEVIAESPYDPENKKLRD